MKKILISSLFFIALPANAVICKSVDGEGNVSYANLPANECENTIKLPPVSRYQPRALPDVGATQNNAVGETTAAYLAMSITQPANNATVRSNEGQVLVSISLKPGLQKGDKLKLAVDGAPVTPLFDGLSVALAGVQRGTHTLSAQIVNSAGVVKLSADSVSFTLRKASLLDPLRTTEDQANTSTTTSNKSTTNNQSSATSSSTPGKTNPSFSPKYKP